MASPINSFQDILDALEQNPSFRDALRRHILTEELLQLPAQFMLLRADVDELKSGQERLEAGVDQLAEGQQRLESTVSQLAEGQERLESTTASMGGTLSRLDGTSYEDHAVDLAPRILRSQFNLSQPRIIARRGERDDLRDIALAATGNDLISDAEANQLQSADFIAAHQDQSGSTVYVLAEISIAVQQPDIDRAADRARILERATGVPTIPAAIGSAFHDDLLPSNVRLLIIPTQQELDDQYRHQAT